MYGIITAEFEQEDSNIWDFKRIEADGSIKEYQGIEYLNRESMQGIQEIGDSRAFNSWLYEHGNLRLDGLN